MLKAFLDPTGSVGPITVSDVDPVALQRIEGMGAVAATLDNTEVARAHDVLVVATEPEDVPHVLAEISPVLSNKVRPPAGQFSERSYACYAYHVVT